MLSPSEYTYLKAVDAIAMPGDLLAAIRFRVPKNHRFGMPAARFLVRDDT